MIESAEESIILSTFDFREGESSTDIAAALIDAADRGVFIRILVDGVSGLFRMESSSFFYAISAHPNIEIRIYNQLSVLAPWKINGRMHDKYLICDDCLYLLGGRNTFDYFLGDYESNSKSCDREVLVYNPSDEGGNSSVIDLIDYFESVWSLDVCEIFHDDESLYKLKSVKNAYDNILNRGAKQGKISRMV